MVIGSLCPVSLDTRREVSLRPSSIPLINPTPYASFYSHVTTTNAYGTPVVTSPSGSGPHPGQHPGPHPGSGTPSPRDHDTGESRRFPPQSLYGIESIEGVIQNGGRSRHTHENSHAHNEVAHAHDVIYESKENENRYQGRHQG
jgi:hypothetical protein